MSKVYAFDEFWAQGVFFNVIDMNLTIEPNAQYLRIVHDLNELDRIVKLQRVTVCKQRTRLVTVFSEFGIWNDLKSFRIVKLCVYGFLFFFPDHYIYDLSEILAAALNHIYFNNYKD
jgi:hypothetical protein